jgi:hypothetical protein
VPVSATDKIEDLQAKVARLVHAGTPEGIDFVDTEVIRFGSIELDLLYQ